MEKRGSAEKVSRAVEVQRLILGESPSGLPAIELTNPSPETVSVVRRVMTSNMVDDPDYVARSKVGAFLQSGQSRDWILIEFWKGEEADHRAFVEYLNNQL